jgi:hypothetical protein
MASDVGYAPYFWQVDSGLDSFVTDGVSVESPVMASGGTLYVQGTGSSDQILLSESGGLIQVRIDGVASRPTVGSASRQPTRRR